MTLGSTTVRSLLKPLALAALLLAAAPMIALATQARAGHHEEAAPAVAPLTTALGLGGYSPVSYFNEAGPHVGSPAISAEHAGVVYFFATDAERDLFNATPERFVPAYSGWCATGMALGKYFPVSATNYKIVNNRLMLFLHTPEADALQMWNDAGEAEQLKKADAFFKAESMKSHGHSH